MKASELVKQLNFLIESSGDFEVVMPIEMEADDEHSDVTSIHSISIGVDADEKPYQFMLCDKETALSFI